MNNTKLWTKDFVLISLTNFFIALPFYLLMTTVAVYVIERFNATQSLAGLAAGIFVIGALISRLLAGKYMEIIGRKKLLFTSLVLFLLSTLLYFPVDSLNLLLVVRFIHGIAFGVSTTIVSTAVMDVIPPERRGEGTGYYSLSMTLATAIGPFLGLIIIQHADYTMIFVACALFSAISIIITIITRIPEAQITKEQIAAIKRFRLQELFEKSAVPLSTIILITIVGFSGIVSFLNAYAISIHLTTAASFFFIVYSVSILISRPFTGRLLDIKGDNTVMYPALLIFASSLAILSQAGHGSALLVAGGLAGLGFGTFMSCGQAIIIKGSPKHRIGLATSTFFFFMDTGMGIGPYLVGSIIPMAGFRGMYMTLAAVVFICVFLYYFMHGKQAGKESLQTAMVSLPDSESQQQV